MPAALTRPVPDGLDRCELTHLARTPIDVPRARAQHESYEAALRACGCTIVRLPAAHDLPDSVFVEDAAVVLDEIAIVTRPGAPSRRAETETVESALARYRPVRRIEAPATLDGGDVLRVGRRLFVGQSTRTNTHAVDALRAIAGPSGYSVEPLTVRGCLHLKSAATEIGDGVVLVNPDWVDAQCLLGLEIVQVDAAEPHAANVLRIGDTIICGAAFPRTAARLRERGLRVMPVEVSELAKAEAGVTCCSLIIQD